MRLLSISVLVLGAALAAAAGIIADDQYEARDTRRHAEAITGGDAHRGRLAFVQKGCGGCHAIRGIAGANGLVGPPLTGVAERAVIGGKLENTPENLMHWIADPQGVVPGNAMPNLPMTRQEQRDIAAFLYTRS